MDSNLKRMRKKSLSCVNIRRRFDAKNLASSASKKLSGDDHSTGIFVCTKRIDDDEGIIPLLEKAGSLSSFNSFTPATEESFLESSTDDCPTKSDYERRRQQKVIRRATTGKIRCLKHRPHSLSLSERNLPRLQQDNSNNVLKEKNDNGIDEVNDNKEYDLSDQSSPCSKENVPCGDTDLNTSNLTPLKASKQNCCSTGMTRKQRRSMRTNNNIINNNVSMTTPTSPLSSPTGNDNENSDDNNNNTSINSEADAQISFSKEQRKRLKQRMRERQKFQDKSVFLGLF